MTDRDAKEEKEQRTLKQWEADKRAQLQADIQSVMNDAGGRRFVWWLLNGVTGTFQDTGSPEDVGRRRAGLTLVAHLQQHSRRGYLQMVQEAINDLPPENLAPEAPDDDEE
jgi:hypothetical protein